MYRRGFGKRVVYLRDDPREFDSLWDDPDHAAIKAELVLESFNQHVSLTTDVGSKRIAPM